MIRSDAPALTPEAREQQLIAKAMKLAEQKLEDGTASSQLICHFLQLGTRKAELELKLLDSKNELQNQQVENLKSQARIEGLYEEAIKVFTTYSGQGDD